MFYERLFKMKRRTNFGWLIILKHEDMPGLEFGLLDRSHEAVPNDLATTPSGVIATFAVEDVEPCFCIARSVCAEVVQQPTYSFFGRRRLLLRDSEEPVIDVSSPPSS